MRAISYRKGGTKKMAAKVRKNAWGIVAATLLTLMACSVLVI
jgi:hypothetical protein